MKSKKLIPYLVLIVAFALITTTIALADDGAIFRRDISKTPDFETEKAAIYMMDFYVPAQASTGLVGPVDNYLLADGTTVAYEARNYAKPLVTVWIDNLGGLELPEGGAGSILGGVSFGEFDAFAGVSLDDGTSWKTTNLSRSAELSSFYLSNGYPYPGDVHNVVHQVAGDHIFVAWASKYCDGGTPLYKLAAEIGDDGTYGDEYLDDLQETYGLDDVYLVDYFGVGGAQRSVDYTLQGHPEVGEIPYSCIWTARGKLLAGDDPTTDETEATYVMWTKPERLTSGRRDANLPAVDCAMGAGCILTWQEDPEGLRPGQGLGPGSGWSGAIANQQTDIWYSYISYADMDLVFDADGTVAAPLTMAEYGLLTDATMPKPYVPMAMPVRLTDNHMCKTQKGQENMESQQLPYCFADFSTSPITLYEEQDTNSTFCTETLDWTNPGGTTLTICVTEDNRLLNGRVAATRVRLNLKPYTRSDGTKSAWVVMAYEETKALGETADPEDPTSDPIDIGKDIWYHSFDMFDHDYVAQGGMLNQPAQCKYNTAEDELCSGLGMGDFYPIQTDDRDNEYYLTEISRRFALTTNSVSAAAASDSGLSAMLIYKQGIINQGGPADIMLRRVVIPDNFDPAVDNPYAFENMECDEWVYTDGLNPNYLKGLCLSPAINISGSTIVDCGAHGSDNDSCAAAFPVEDDGSCPDCTQQNFPKVYEWRQCDGASGIEGCEDDNDLDDQSWENPYDVAKGHRGFVDGDMVMIMYAWAPNWNSNTVGNDHYNLYVRRSFDGGITWTTTPADLGGEGTSYYEYYYDGQIGVPKPVEWIYVAGDFEQARNVSKLTGNQVTILDPRYSPTGGMKLYPTIRTDWLTENGFSFEGLPYDDDFERARDKFFIVYETGDNTTVAYGEATALDLFYSRATVYGDIYEEEEYCPKDPDGECQEVKTRWPWLENKADIMSGEASVLANPGGTFMYAVWNQWQEELLPDGHELVYNSDILFRRLMYLPDDTTLTYFVAEIIYQSADRLTDQNLNVAFAGTTRGREPVEYLWTSDLDGTLSTDQFFTIPGKQLQIGKHTITFTARDVNGKWAKAATATLDVGYSLYLPAIKR